MSIFGFSHKLLVFKINHREYVKFAIHTPLSYEKFLKMAWKVVKAVFSFHNKSDWNIYLRIRGRKQLFTELPKMLQPEFSRLLRFFFRKNTRRWLVNIRNYCLGLVNLCGRKKRSKRENSGCMFFEFFSIRSKNLRKLFEKLSACMCTGTWQKIIKIERDHFIAFLGELSKMSFMSVGWTFLDSDWSWLAMCWDSLFSWN